MSVLDNVLSQDQFLFGNLPMFQTCQTVILHSLIRIRRLKLQMEYKDLRRLIYILILSFLNIKTIQLLQTYNRDVYMYSLENDKS